MKKIAVISLVIILTLALMNPVAAQKEHRKGSKPHNAVKHHPGNKKAVKAHPYHRNKVVVVKPRKHKTVKVLPAGHTTILFRGKNFYHHDFCFYHHIGESYALLPPPIGIRVKIIHPGHRKIFIGGAPHFYYMGVYYKQIENEYETVEPAVGTVVPEIPLDEAEEVTIDGKTYFEFDGFLYKSIVTGSGVQYEMVGKLED